MKLPAYNKERVDGERPLADIFHALQDFVSETIRRLNEAFATSDRLSRRQLTLFQHTAWAAANTALAEMPFFRCPYEMEILSVYWVGQDAIAANSSDYRTFTIGRYRDGSSEGTIATRDTSASATVAFTPFELTLSSSDSVLRCEVGDVLTVAMPETGTGPAVGEGGFTIDYEIIREVENAS